MKNKEAVQWGCQCLMSLHFTLKNDIPEKIQHTPWSYVVRFETTVGYVYLKQTPEKLALEPIIIQTLRTQFYAATPTIIASNPELHCFLMRDAGCSLRVQFKQKFDEVLVCRAVAEFTALQIIVSERVDVLLNLGVPDWSLAHFTALYTGMLADKDLLMSDGMSTRDIHDLMCLTPKITSLCQQLSSFAIKQTLVQPDCNDNNTLVDVSSMSLTWIDLGEIVISHPFFSLINFLHQLNKHHGLKETSDAFIRIKQAGLDPYLAFESRENILEAFVIAKQLWMVYWVLAHYRLMLACGKEQVMNKMPGRFYHSLMTLKKTIICDE